LTATEMTGWAPTSKRWITGSWISRGSSPRIDATLPRTSWLAMAVGTSSRNRMTIVDTPSWDVLSTCLIPWTVLIASSIFLVTSRSTVSGEAPG
jgi:hypothetical protein